MKNLKKAIGFVICLIGLVGLVGSGTAALGYSKYDDHISKYDVPYDRLIYHIVYDKMGKPFCERLSYSEKEALRKDIMSDKIRINENSYRFGDVFEGIDNKQREYQYFDGLENCYGMLRQFL